MLPARLAGGGAAGFVDGGGTGRAMGEELFALEELLRDGGDVAPRGEVFRGDPVGEAEAAIGGDAGELPREKFPGEFIPGGFVEGPSRRRIQARRASGRAKSRGGGHGRRVPERRRAASKGATGRLSGGGAKMG
jgi:hypothetical protein